MRNQIYDHEAGSRKKMFIASLAIHIVLLGVFPILLANFRRDEEPEKIEVVFYKPEERPKPPPAPKPKPESKPKPPLQVKPEMAKVVPPPPKSKPKPPPPNPKPEPRVQTAPEVAQVQPPPPTPKPKPRPVKTGSFGEAKAETVARATPRRETRSAGFGDAVASAETPPPRRNLRAGTSVGGFEVDPRPADDSPAPKQTRIVSTSSFGDEAPAAAPATASRNRGSVQSTGFTVEVAEDTAPARRSGTGSVSTGGFGDTVAVNEVPRARKKPPAENPDTPVEIISKPKPNYTAEARDLKIEGEVVLRVVFVASGEMRVIGVVEGLGHGLDEAAVDAAKQIEFKPARRNGEAVDYKAVVRIVFQLA
jgi:TonB family protein